MSRSVDESQNWEHDAVGSKRESRFPLKTRAGIALLWSCAFILVFIGIVMFVVGFLKILFGTVFVLAAVVALVSGCKYFVEARRSDRDDEDEDEYS